jgi:hypothetical protein
MLFDFLRAEFASPRTACPDLSRRLRDGVSLYLYFPSRSVTRTRRRRAPSGLATHGTQPEYGSSGFGMMVCRAFKRFARTRARAEVWPMRRGDEEHEKTGCGYFRNSAWRHAGTPAAQTRIATAGSSTAAGWSLTLTQSLVKS